MLNKFFKRAVSVLLLICTLFTLSACTTPSGNMYFSKDKDVALEKASAMLKEAQDKTDAYTDIKYTYSYFVELDTGKDMYKFGTENAISFTGRGTQNAKAHRVNTETSLKNESVPETKSENFYYNNGKIYTTRFGKYYYSEMPSENFLPYTEYSSLSVNTDFLNESFFGSATVYNRFSDITEIAFTQPVKALTGSIVSFIGLDQTKYIYTIDDVVLSVIINENGCLTEKHLLFNVDYYSEADPDNVLTYEGHFAYVVNETESITVEERSKADNYQHISNIELLSSLTTTGYQILLDMDAFDVSHEKHITVSDLTGTTYTYDTGVRVTAALKGSLLNYSSIVTTKFTTDEDVFVANGIFITGNELSSRKYDFIENKLTSSTDGQSHEKKSNELLQDVMDGIGAERLYNEDIAGVSVKEEDSESVTYTVRLDGNSAKSFSSYVLDMFAKSEDDALDSSTFITSIVKCDVEIKVRKSDGCILSQTIDYAARLNGITGAGQIDIEAKFNTVVNSTDASLPMLNMSDWDNTVNPNNA